MDRLPTRPQKFSNAGRMTRYLLTYGRSALSSSLPYMDRCLLMTLTLSKRSLMKWWRHCVAVTSSVLLINCIVTWLNDDCWLVRAMVVEQKKGNIVEERANRVSASAKSFLTRALQPNPLKRCKIIDLLRHRWLARSVAMQTNKIVKK